MSEIYSFNDYQSCLNQEFLIEQEPDQWISATLVEASELEFEYPVAAEGKGNAFSLVFRADRDVHLSQRIYTINGKCYF